MYVEVSKKIFCRLVWQAEEQPEYDNASPLKVWYGDPERYLYWIVEYNYEGERLSVSIEGTGVKFVPKVSE